MRGTGCKRYARQEHNQQSAWPSTAPKGREHACSKAFGDRREFDQIRDGSHELFSPAKIKMKGDGVSVVRSELSWNVVGNM